MVYVCVSGQHVPAHTRCGETQQRAELPDTRRPGYKQADRGARRRRRERPGPARRRLWNSRPRRGQRSPGERQHARLWLLRRRAAGSRGHAPPAEPRPLGRGCSNAPPPRPAPSWERTRMGRGCGGVTCEPGEPADALGDWEPLQVRGELHLHDAGHALQHHPRRRRPLLPSPEPQRRLRQQQRGAAGARSRRPGGGGAAAPEEVSCPAPIGRGRVTCAPVGPQGARAAAGPEPRLGCVLGPSGCGPGRGPARGAFCVRRRWRSAGRTLCRRRESPRECS